MPPKPSGCNVYPHGAPPGHILNSPMRVLEALANIFITTFGITQPSDAMRRKVAWFILCLLILALGFVSVVGGVFYRLLNH